MTILLMGEDNFEKYVQIPHTLPPPHWNVAKWHPTAMAKIVKEGGLKGPLETEIRKFVLDLKYTTPEGVFVYFEHP